MNSVEQWFNNFYNNPVESLEFLLKRKVFLGALNSNEIPEIIYRIFSSKSAEDKKILDTNLSLWFEQNWRKQQSSITTKRWADILKDAINILQHIELKETINFLKNHLADGRKWLRTLYFSPALDPEAALLNALAVKQSNRDLINVWENLCRGTDDLPEYYPQIGILGLRKLPANNNTRPNGLSAPLFTGLIEWLRVVEKRKLPLERWQSVCKMIISAYPRSLEYWVEQFAPLIDYDSKSFEAKYIDKCLKGFINKLKNSNKNSNKEFSHCHSKEECDNIIKLIEKNKVSGAYDKLQEFIKKHKNYAYSTGNSENLTIAFRRIAKIIINEDHNLAKDLLYEAFRWEPSEPRVWMELALLKIEESNFLLAEFILWEAKNKFPEDEKFSNYLAEVLKKQNKYFEAEQLYRQVMLDFPEDPFCRNGLADVLKKQKRYIEAEQIYKQVMQDFPNNPICLTGLASVLILSGKSDEAIQILEDAVSSNVCDEVTYKYLEKFKSKTDKDIETINNDESTKLTDEFDYNIELPDDEFFRNINKNSAYLGYAELYRNAAKLSNNDNKTDLFDRAANYLDKINQDEDNDNLSLEKGWLLIDMNNPENEDYFYSKSQSKPKVLGYKIGLFRSKN